MPPEAWAGVFMFGVLALMWLFNWSLDRWIAERCPRCRSKRTRLLCEVRHYETHNCRKCGLDWDVYFLR